LVNTGFGLRLHLSISSAFIRFVVLSYTASLSSLISNRT
jgi:hypothetical protein